MAILREYEGNLKDVLGVASGQEVGFEVQGVAEEVRAMGANAADAEKLAVWQAQKGEEGWNRT